jgi:hypothetical protein
MMMKQFFIYVICLLIFLITNCTPKAAEQISDNTADVETEFYKKLAEDMCICTKDLIDVLKEQKKLSKEERIKLKIEFDEKIESEAEKSEFCIARLQEENLRGIREIKQDLSETALKEYCPDFYYMSKIGRIR